MVRTEVLHRSVGWRAWLVATLTACLLVTGPAPARADIATSDFPTATQVKASMKGVGRWQRSLGDPNSVALGANPATCRSDLPFAAATEFRNSYFRGSVARSRKYTGVVEVTVYRYASPESAAQALTGLPEFLSTCSRSVEWVCQNCDGIATIYRTPAAERRAGQQSVTWNQRSVGMGVANGHAIAARTGSTVVVTVASHLSDPESIRTPPRPTWKRTLTVARKALARARP